MSFLYRLPPSAIKQVLTSKDVSILQAAWVAGLLPDPWLQTAQLTATLENVMCGSKTRAEQCLRTGIVKRRPSGEDLAKAAKARARGT